MKWRTIIQEYEVKMGKKAKETKDKLKKR